MGRGLLTAASHGPLHHHEFLREQCPIRVVLAVTDGSVTDTDPVSKGLDSGLGFPVKVSSQGTSGSGIGQTGGCHPA